MNSNTKQQGVSVAKDGTPLKQSLKRANARQRRNAFLLATPLLAFILITYGAPIFEMLLRSVDNHIVGQTLPKTITALQNWNEVEDILPEESVYSAIVEDIKTGKKENTIGRIARRLNYELSGIASLFRSSMRKIERLNSPPYKEALIKLDKRWGNLAIWRLIKRESGPYTLSYYLAAMDMHFSEKGNIERQPENRRIYLKLFWRTLYMSAIITLLCAFLGFPVAYLLATLPLRRSNLLMILVLLPFWTSLLVRTTAWIALLQREAVINNILVAIGLIDDNTRLELIYNATGTLIAMTHILLPFMILPLYSVMKTIPPDYMRAARSLGATKWVAFARIYFPQTLPGLGAGGILVFILAIGYYITPTLVGGTSGTFISSFIANHISITLNWGLAAALGVILLVLVLIFYFLYDKIVGINNMKLG